MTVPMDLPGATRPDRWPTPHSIRRNVRNYRWLFFLTSLPAPGMFLLQKPLVGTVLTLAAAVGLAGWIAGIFFTAGYNDALIHAAEDAAELAALPREIDRWWWVDLPIAADGQGYLYAIEFETGVVKVGQTNHAARRIAEHRRDAWAYNVAMIDVWVSVPHADYLANELRLIAFAASVAERAKREYFHGADFEKVRKFGLSLVAQT